ncbi:MAG: VWA domain-containing protein [Candidatus Yanofskybacteria bacterium]|nr:VWA domain-containing protein [Candidatus Yanofskybacteria bacterium]
MKLKYCLCFFLSAFLASPVYAQQDKPDFKSRVEVVNVDFRVTNKSGDTIIGDLTNDDFEVYEDKVKQEITNFSAIEGPITTVLLIDYSRQSYLMSLYSQEEVWYGPIEFVRSLKDEDWAAIIMYDRKVYTDKDAEKNGIFQNFTQSKNELEKTLNNIFRSPAVWNESCLVDAIKSTIDMVNANRESLTDKVSLVIVSTGLDTFSKNRYDKVLEEAQNSGVVIYAIGIGGQLKAAYGDRMSTDDRMDLLVSDNRLKSFSELTGGEFFQPRFVSELPDIFKNISVYLRNQYSLGYISSNLKRDGKFRKIEVRVKKTWTNKKGKEEKLTAHNRKGYFAPKD